MIGILIIAHGELGSTLIHCATHVLGHTPAKVASMAVAGRVDPDALLEQAKQHINDLDDGAGVLILTDMVGGTPSNIATRALIPGQVEGLSGANLPMLVRALTYRQSALATVLSKAMAGGKEGVFPLVAAPIPHAASRN